MTSGEIMTAGTPAVAATGPRLGGLDGLRGVAAIAVVIHHVAFDSGATFRQPFTQLLARADIGVSIFFVLSGFLLYRPFIARLLDGRAAPTTKEFWLKRFFRLYPAYWVAMAVMLIVGGIRVRGPIGLALSATLTHGYHPRRAIAGITQSWTLVTEIAFYVMLPFFHRLTERFGRRRTVNQRAIVSVIGLVGLYLMSVIFRIWIAVSQPVFGEVSTIWFISRADVFALGMALAVGYAWASHNAVVAAAIASVSRRVVFWYCGAAFLFWFMATQLGLAIGWQKETALRGGLGQFAYGLIAFAMVLPMAWGGGVPSLIGRALDSRVMTYLGTVSYGIYLWHQWFLEGTMSLLHWKTFSGHFWVLLLLVMVCSTTVAELSHRFIEAPLMRLVPRLLHRSSTEAAVKVPASV
jgi:peptidoglycan/LPS O-acetylase OafA/YrhL